jgi:transcriptional regulator with XRE-family HTH domain
MKPRKSEVCTLPELAKRLRAFRGDRTQAAVSSAAGKNTATYTYWESGTTEPGALALARACLFMGCTPNDVLLKGHLSSLGEDLPKDVYGDLVDVIQKLIELQATAQPGQPSPVTIFNRFLRDFPRSVGARVSSGTPKRTRAPKGAAPVDETATKQSAEPAV